MTAAPGPIQRLLAAPVAHRGLWRPGAAPENSLAAFAAACEAGFALELDARLTADGEAVVFHDEALDRMTAVSGLVEEQAADALCVLRLLGSDQRIPALADALALVAGRTPVLVELKTPPGQEGLLERRVADLLAAYDGPAAALSFNAEALGWLADHRPALPRGLNVRTPGDLSQVARARPHLLSASLGLAADPAVQALRRTGLPVVAWTARSRRDLEALAGLADGVMFEGFQP